MSASGSVRNPIPENYILKKIVEALIDELEREGILNSAHVKARIIEKGNPNPT